MNLAITCFPTFGGSGIVATEIGLGMAARGHRVHFVCAELPWRLSRFVENVFFHEVQARDYPLFDQSPYALALTSKLVEVASWERLDHWPLFAEPIELAFNRSHMLARRNEIEMQHLSGERLLGFAALEVAQGLSERLRAHGLGGGTAHQVETDHDLLALVESNVGIGFVPASAPESPEIRRQIIKGLDLERVVSVLAVAGRQRAAVATTLLNLLRAADWPYRDVNRSP